MNESKTGTWVASCPSTHRSGRYANFYTFYLPSSTTVTIDLSSSVDTYLFLLDGEGKSGAIIETDDDGGAGRDSMITRTLSQGYYTLEATTFSSAAIGSFTISLSN